MAGKFHINSSGDVRVCNATVRPCKFGESDHFTDRAEARKAVETKLEEEHGTAAPSIKSKKADKAKADTTKVDAAAVKEEVKETSKADVKIDQRKVAAITEVSSSTYERAVRSMASRSRSISIVAGLSSYNTSESYDEQATELPDNIQYAESVVFEKEPLSVDDKELLDNAVATYKSSVNEACENDWDDESRMMQIERSAAELSTTFKNLVKARRGS